MKRRDILKRSLAGLMTAAMLFSNSAVTTLAAEPEEVTAEAVTAESEEDTAAFVGDAEEPVAEVAADAVEDEEMPAPEPEEPDGADYGELLKTEDLGYNGTVVSSVYYNGTDYTLVVGESGSTGVSPCADAKNKFPDYYDKITELVFLPGITANDGIYNLPAVKHITFPKSLKSIGLMGFSGYSSLDELVIPATITYIGREAFANAVSLKKIVFEKRTEPLKLGPYAFKSCNSLTEVTIPADITYSTYFDEAGVFSACESLKKVTLEKGMTDIPYCLLANMPNLEEVIIPDSVKTIEGYAFAYCPKLTDIQLPSKLEQMGEYLFVGTGIKKITIPGSVTFMGLTFAQEQLGAEAPIEEVIFEEGSETLVFSGTFYGSSTLRSLTLPARPIGVRTQYAVFANCTNLETISFAKGAKEVPNNIFFNHLTLKNVIMPDSITSIGREAFGNCVRLEEIHLPPKISSIGEGAFSGCGSLTTVYSSKQKNKITIGENNEPLLDAEWIVSGNGGDEPKPQPVTGEITMNGEKVNSLQAAFKSMKDSNADYVIVLDSDVTGEKNLSIPKTAKSVTINGNGHSITINGGKLTSAADLVLEDVNLAAVNKKGAKAKLNVNAKKNLIIEGDVNYDAVSTTVKVKNELILNSSMKANNITTATLILNAHGELRAEGGNKIMVKTLLKGNGGAIDLAPDFNKAITLGGSAEGEVRIIGGPVADGTQIFTAKAKKLPAADLLTVFDVSEVTENETDTHLYYFSGSKVCIFGESISYNGNNYALWKDVIAQMDKDVKAGTKVLEIELNGDVNIKGAFKLPKKGYESITINGNGHSITFTGDIKLTGNTVISMDTVLKKVGKKGERQAGKINNSKGTYSYEGPEIKAQD